MESFELGKELEKDVFRPVTRVTDTVSEVYYEVHSPKLAISLILSKNITLSTHADPSSVQDGVSWELRNRSRLQ